MKNIISILIIIIILFLISNYLSKKDSQEMKGINVTDYDFINICEFYANCNKTKYNPLDKTYSFCGINIQKEELINKCKSIKEK